MNMEFRDEVILGLECCIKSDETGLCPAECQVRYKYGHECETGLKRDALKLLKEQEPKPVKVTKNAYNYEFYHCPNCGRDFDLTYYKKPAYCDKCGQAVKWDD